MTTINALQRAKELPELFMKSEEEAVLWRMLRRMSDQVKIDLNTTDMEKASNVQEYRIKDIVVKINVEDSELTFVKGDYRTKLDMQLLLQNPSSAFKELRKMVLM